MADIGRSTDSHGSGRDVVRLLTNWGNWMSCIEHPGRLEISMQPMFRYYVAGFRETSAGRIAEDVDKAERLDGVLVKLSERDRACLILRYVVVLSSRAAANFLCRYDRAQTVQGRFKCSDKTYSSWLDIAEANAEIVCADADGIELPYEPVYGVRRRTG